MNADRLLRGARRRLASAWRAARHELRWLLHADRLRVPKAQRDHYRVIFDRTWKQLGCSPDIFRGEDYNNKIKWLMLFDQRPEIVRCSDKLAVRDYVRETVGERYLNALYGVWDRAEDIDFDSLPRSFVLKTNHDSGSVWVVPEKAAADLEAIRREVAASLRRRNYGADKGEWCYQHIEPKAFAEEYMDAGPDGIADFKFHCSEGKVLFLQYIYDRNKEVIREQLIDYDGIGSLPSIDHEFQEGNRFIKPESWSDLIIVAELLSASFKYVRVDLYSVGSEIRFGEMTFYPKNGNYKTQGQRVLGQRIEFDRSELLSALTSI